jgi:hypothetical protein
MKNKIHLFYGIIIGILLCACVGGTSDTSTSSGSIQNKFKEFKVVYPFQTSGYGASFLDEKEIPKEGRVDTGRKNDNGDPYFSVLGFATKPELNLYEPESHFIFTTDISPQGIVKTGWAIIDMEFDKNGKTAYLIGK